MNAAEIVRAAKAAGMIIPERTSWYSCSSCYAREAYENIPKRLRGEKAIRTRCGGCRNFVEIRLVVINSWPDLITGQCQTGSEFPLAA